MLNIKLVRDICQGKRTVSKNVPKEGELILVCPPFEDVSCALSLKDFNSNNASTSNLCQLNNIIHSLKSYLIDKPKIKTCFEAWFALQDAKKQPLSAANKKRKLSKCKDEPTRPVKLKCPNENEIRQKVAAEREKMFGQLREYVRQIVDSAPTMAELKLTKKPRPPISSLSVKPNNDSNRRKVLTSRLKSPIKRWRPKPLRKRLIMSPLKQKFIPKKHKSVSEDLARSLVKKSSHYLKPFAHAKRTQSLEPVLNDRDVDDLVEREMVSKRGSLKNVSRDISRSFAVTQARAKGPEHPLTRTFHLLRMRDRLTELISKQIPVYIIEDEKEVLKNLTSKISKSARQHGSVSYSTGSVSNVPRFDLNIRKPFKEYNANYATDGNKITSDGEDLNEERFMSMVNRKIKDSFYETEIERKHWNIGDDALEAMNVESVYTFIRDSAYGDVAYSRRDMYSGRVISRTNVSQPTILAQEIIKNYTERGRRIAKRYCYVNLLEILPKPLPAPLDSFVSPSISPPNLDASSFLPSTSNGEESPTSVLPEEFLITSLRPDALNRCKNYYDLPDKRQIILAPYCAPFSHGSFR